MPCCESQETKFVQVVNAWSLPCHVEKQGKEHAPYTTLMQLVFGLTVYVQRVCQAKLVAEAMAPEAKGQLLEL